MARILRCVLLDPLNTYAKTSLVELNDLRAWLRSGALLLWVEVESPIDFTLRDAETKDYHLQLHRVVIPRGNIEEAQQAAASQPRKGPQS